MPLLLPMASDHVLDVVNSCSLQAGQLSVPAPQTPSNDNLHQRTAFVGAAGVILALAALALWSAQAWRCPHSLTSFTSSPSHSWILRDIGRAMLSKRHCVSFKVERKARISDISVFLETVS